MATANATTPRNSTRQGQEERERPSNKQHLRTPANACNNKNNSAGISTRATGSNGRQPLSPTNRAHRFACMYACNNEHDMLFRPTRDVLGAFYAERFGRGRCDCHPQPFDVQRLHGEVAVPACSAQHLVPWSSLCADRPRPRRNRRSDSARCFPAGSRS